MNFTALRSTSMFLASAAVGFATLIAAAPATAGDFQPKRVAADAKWLAYVNVDGILKSDLGKFFMEHGSELGFEFEDGDMQELEAFGVNLTKDLRSITVYGHGNPDAQPQFVALLETSAAVDDALAQFTGMAAAQNADGDGDADKDVDNGDDITSIEIAGQKVHLISDGEQTTFIHVRPGGNSDERLVVVSMDREWIAKGLGVLEGKVASLTGADKPGVSFKPADGTLAFAVCNDLSWVEIDDGDQPASSFVKAAKGIECSYGQSGDDTFFNVRLDAGTKEDAQNLGDIARGLVAMGRFAGGQQPELKPLMEPMRSLKLDTEGSFISLSVKHQTSSLIDAFKAMAALSGSDDDDEDVDEDDEDEDDEKVEVKAEVSLGKTVKDKNDDND